MGNEKRFSTIHFPIGLGLIAHRLSTIVNADFIYVLQGGRIVEQGTSAELLNNDGNFSHMVQLQGITS